MLLKLWMAVTNRTTAVSWTTRWILASEEVRIHLDKAQRDVINTKVFPESALARYLTNATAILTPSQSALLRTPFPTVYNIP